MTGSRALRERRVALRAWPSAFLAGLAALAPAVAAEQAEVEPGFEKGKFQELTEPIGRLIKLTCEDKALRLDRKHWERQFKGKTKEEALKALEDELIKQDGMRREQAARHARRLLNMPPVAMAFERLKRLVGYRSSGEFGGDGMRKEFGGSGLTARMQVSGRSVRIVLEEEEAPARSLEVRDGGWGDLRIVLFDAKGKLLLVVNQTGEGQFTVAHVTPGGALAATATSFEAFHARRRRYVQERLFPLLKHMGVVLPCTRYAPRVKRAVLDKMSRPLTPEQIERGRKLVQQLNDNSFKKREQATKALSANFRRYRDLIGEAMKRASTSPEALTRLRRIVAANADQDEVDQFVAARKLTEDIAYLIYLVQEVEAADRGTVVRALEGLTKQKLGPDPAAWKRWWSANRPAEKPSEKGSDGKK